MEYLIPVGYRFRPTDEELVDHYLKYKLLGDDCMVQHIAEIDICKYEPWDLPAFSRVKSDDPEWFFFSPRQLKYTNSNRSNRATKAGFWKATGKDRNICKRGTDDAIGTKKTLVFYKGRVPHGVKTNWVIHEYHAVTFPVDKRTFVLCRLMEKPEKKPEVRTDELIHEGEPVATDHDNLAIAYTITEADIWPQEVPEPFPLALQMEEYDFSPNVTDQELFPSSTFANFGNENMLQYPFDTTEEEDDVDLSWKSFLVDEDVVIREERRNAFVNGSAQSQVLTKVYYESSETDVELASAQSGNIDDNTSASRHVFSGGYQVMRMVDTSQDAVYAQPLLSSKTEVKREKKDSTVGDNFGSVNTAGDIENISSTPTISSSSTSRKCKTKYHSRRSQKQINVSSKAESQHQPEVKKETSIQESNKDQTKSEDVMSRKKLEATINHSSSLNRKGSFIDMQTPSVSHNPNPRLVYLVNVIIGFSLLIVTIWDMVSFGKLY